MKKKLAGVFLGGFLLCAALVAAGWGALVWMIHKEDVERRFSEER